MFRESNVVIRIFVLEDWNEGAKRGFVDLIVPCIQKALQPQEKAFVLRSEMQPSISNSSIDCNKDRKYTVNIITKSDRKEERIFNSIYPLEGFSLFILDNQIGEDDEAGKRTIEKILSSRPEARCILLTAWDYCPSQKYLCIPKNYHDKLILEIKAIKHITKYEKIIDKVGVFIGDETSLADVDKEKIYILNEKVSDISQLTFLKGYIESINRLENEDVKRLCELADDRAIPIAIKIERVAGGVDANPLWEKGIFHIENSEGFLYHLTRFIHSPTIIGGREMTKVLRKIIKHTLPLSSGKGKTNRGVFVTGPTGSGKEEIAKIIHSLSTHNKNKIPPDLVICPAVRGQSFESWFFGKEKGGNIKEGESGIEKAKDSSIFIDEAAEYDEKFGGQGNLLLMLEGKPGTKLFAGADSEHKIDIKNTKFILATDGKVKEQLKNRCSIIEVKSIQERKDDLIPLAQYFAVKNGKWISDEALNLLKNNMPPDVRILRKIVEETIPQCSLMITEEMIVDKLVNIDEKKMSIKSNERRSSTKDFVQEWKDYLHRHKKNKTVEDIINGLPDDLQYEGSGEKAGFGVLLSLARNYGWQYLQNTLKEPPIVGGGFINRKSRALLKKLGINNEEHEVVFLYKNIGFAKVSGKDIQRINDITYYDFVVIEKKTKNVLAPENNKLEKLILLESEKLKEFDVEEFINYRNMQGNKSKGKVENKNDSK